MAESNVGKTIEVFLIDGTPNGLVQCRIDLYGIIGYRIPRKGIQMHKDRSHLQQAGIYFLFGKSEDEETNIIYIGQAIKRQNGEGILCRLKEHAKEYTTDKDKEKNKDFWTEAIAFTTVDGADLDLNYLENKLYHFAKDAGRYDVRNGNTPNPGVVSEARQNTFDKIIEDIKIATGLFGHNVFVPVPIENVILDEQLFYIKKGTEKEAKCNFTNEGFWVLEGSYIDEKQDSLSDGYKKLRDKYSEIIINNKLTKNILFTSLSAASSFVYGRNSNGQKDWKTKDGKSYSEVENEVNS